jgi:hypothetical protein
VCLLLIVSLVGAIGIRLVTGPQCQVIAEQLHDEGRILVRFFVQSIKLSNGIVEGLLGNLASLVGGVEDLIVEHREVESQSQTNRVGRRQVGLGNTCKAKEK